MTRDTKPRKTGPLKLLLTLLRWGLCAAAVAFLYRAVNWHDQIRIGGPAGEYVRLVSRTADEGPFTILQNGQQRVLGRDEVHFVNNLPDIHYGIKAVVSNIEYGWVWLSLLLFAPVPIMAAQRLVWMLRMQDVPLSLWSSIKLTYAGNFFNFALPGTTGGDLIKAYYLTNYTHRKTEAVTTVFLDRVVGLIGLLILAISMLLVKWNAAEFQELSRGLSVIVGGLLLAAAFVFSKRLRHAVGLPALAQKLPGGQQILRVGRTLTALRTHKWMTLAALALTVVLQMLVMVSVYYASLALNMKGDFLHYLIYVPIVFLVGALPIAPPQGVGVIEFFCVKFFNGMLGNSVAQAFALALAMRLIQLVWALPGVLVPLLGSHLPRSDELHELEEIDEDPDNSEDAAPMSTFATNLRAAAAPE